MPYLDANATEILRPEARQAVLAALDLSGNPASIHAAGRQARALLEQARASIAATLGALPAHTVFCSGGTEANALAIAGLGANRRLLVGATEHDAVRAAAPGAETLPVHQSGVIDLVALESALKRGGPALVCLMLANNETGVLHPIAEAAALCRAHGALLHVDAVQAAGRLKIDFSKLGADSLAISGHKFGGPKGAGALLLRSPNLPPLIAGGGQESGRRGGTQALPAIAGMAAALQAAASTLDSPAIAALRDQAETACVAAGGQICGTGPRLPNTLCVALPHIRAELQVIKLDLAGIAVSAGAACSSGKVTASHVLAAMGLEAGHAIRVSLPWNALQADIERFATAYTAMAAQK